VSKLCRVVVVVPRRSKESTSSLLSMSSCNELCVVTRHDRRYTMCHYTQCRITTRHDVSLDIATLCVVERHDRSVSRCRRRRSTSTLSICVVSRHDTSIDLVDVDLCPVSRRWIDLCRVTTRSRHDWSVSRVIVVVSRRPCCTTRITLSVSISFHSVSRITITTRSSLHSVSLDESICVVTLSVVTRHDYDMTYHGTTT